MPLMIAPYTLGVFLPAAPVTPTGAAYYLKQQAWWVAAVLVLWLC